MDAVSRRDFLKLGALSTGALAFNSIDSILSPWPPGEFARPVGRARVTTTAVYIYKDPDFKSERIGRLKRDELPRIYKEVLSPYGPRHNRLWYELENGYGHSAYLQRVEQAHLNPVLPAVPQGGQLGEVTVPYSQSFRRTLTYGWVPLYRLYYQSVYWITSLEEGPDGKVWYGLTDDLLHIQYCVPAAHLRPIQPQELSPISPEVPAAEKRIEISTAGQILTAFEGDEIVRQTKISTGIPSKNPTPNGIPTATPKGYFHIEVKIPSRHMGDGNLTDDIEAYELPGVPWVSFFHLTGVGTHGTYWHDNFGLMMSHGCVNMRNEDARWVYRWSNPVAGPQDWNRKGHGTLIHVI